MIIFYALLLVLMMIGAKPKLRTFHSNYTSRESSGATKGIFTVIIFMRHVFPYVELGSTPLDTWFRAADRFLGQSIVCLFLFFTGFGIYEAYKKRRDYFDTFLEKRFLVTLVHFDLAVMLYWLLQVAVFGKFISLSELCRALIGLSSLANSNWYMFYIFIAYIIAFVSFRLSKKQDGIAILLVVALTFVYIFYARRSNIDVWWYDTALCVPLGMIYSFLKDKIDAFMQKNNAIYYSVTLITAGTYVGATLLHFRTGNLALVIVSRLLFTLAYVFITMKLSMNNAVLSWLGRHSFAIYVLQRIPMLILERYCLPDMNRYVFTVISLVLTIAIAFLFNLATKAIDKLLFSKTPVTQNTV